MLYFLLTLLAAASGNAFAGTKELFACARSLAEEAPRAGTSEIGMALRGGHTSGMDRILILREGNILSFEVSPRELAGPGDQKAVPPEGPARERPQMELRSRAYRLLGNAQNSAPYLDFEASVVTGRVPLRLNYESINLRRNPSDAGASVRNLYQKAEEVNFGTAGPLQIQGQTLAKEPKLVRYAELAIAARVRQLVAMRDICMQARVCNEENHADVRRIRGCLDALESKHGALSRVVKKYLDAMLSDIRNELEGDGANARVDSPQQSGTSSGQ